MLLKLSIWGGILILFIIVVRFFAINKLPKKFFMLLWDIVLLRLVLPFNLPFNCLINGSNSFSKIYNAPIVKTGLNHIMPIDPLPYNSVNWLLVIWVVGMVIVLFFFGILYCKEYQKLQTSLPVKRNTEESLKSLASIPNWVHIYVSDRVYTPLTFGIFVPKIVLPKFLELTSSTELKYVLTHEFIHIKRADNLRKIIMLIVIGIHWFNPLVWIMYYFFNRDIELSCDEKVINVLGQECKKEYAMTLVNLTERQSKHALFSNGFGKNAIQERIVAIMKFKRLPAINIICAVALTGITITAFAQNKAEAISNNKSFDASTDPIYAVSNSKYFPEYEKYGLSYDASGNHLIFDGEIVGYFHDETDKGVYTHITDKTGMVGILVLRDSEYKITELTKVKIPYIYNIDKEDLKDQIINETNSTDQMEELLESDGQTREYGYPVNTYSYVIEN